MSIIDKRMILRLLTSESPERSKCGATLAHRDLESLIPQLESAKRAVGITVDFTGVEHVNGSYVRATVAWLIRCGISFRKNESIAVTSGDEWVVRPLEIEHVFVQNLGDEVRENICGLLSQPSIKLACLEVNDASHNVGSVLGHLDRQLRECLSRVYDNGGEARASDLHEKYPEDRVVITAWNNRLSALYERLLLTREKDGRFWNYKVLTKTLQSNGIPIQNE